MDCSAQKTAIFLSSPISCPQALPFSTPFSGLSASCSPHAHLMLLGASSCLTTFCASIFSSSCHSPPISSSRVSPDSLFASCSHTWLFFQVPEN